MISWDGGMGVLSAAVCTFVILITINDNCLSSVQVVETNWEIFVRKMIKKETMKKRNDKKQKKFKKEREKEKSNDNIETK